MVSSVERQQIVDDEHLRILSVAYLILGIMHAVSAVFPLLYVAMGLFMVYGVLGHPGPDMPPREIGWLLAAFGLVITLLMVAFAVLQIYTARCIRLRRSRTLCMVGAAATCLVVPIGTALGVFTFIVFGRPTVQARFDAGAACAAPPDPLAR